MLASIVRALFAAALLLAAPEALASAPRAAQLQTRAEIAAERGDTRAAVTLLHAAVVADPAGASSYVRLGDLYAAMGRANLARKYFAIALTIEPALPAALKGIAMLDIAAGNKAAAEATIEYLATICGPDCPEAAQIQKALTAKADVLDKP